MIYSHIIRILGGYNCFLLCFILSGLCTLYQLKRMSFPVKCQMRTKKNAQLQIKIAIINYLVVPMSDKQ